MSAVANAKPLVAFKGEVVTCDGKARHRLFRLTMNLIPGSTLVAACLKRISFKAQKPVDGKRIKRTCQCGGVWIRNNAKETGIQIHFADGWRPE